MIQRYQKILVPSAISSDGETPTKIDVVEYSPCFGVIWYYSAEHTIPIMIQWGMNIDRLIEKAVRWEGGDEEAKAEGKLCFSL